MENHWPNVWKRGEWIPILKKEDPQERANYRPVTVLTAVDKVFEQLICKQLTAMFETIFDPFLSAYRSTFSCETTLLRLIEDCKQAADNGHSSVMLSTDMSKAFDSLHPKLLLAKLKAYGLSDSALTLVRSYFSNREKRTRVQGNCTSEWGAVNRGCPQGSSLGPLLWNVYQNDLFYCGVNSQLSAYTDDHQLYYSNKDLNTATEVIKNDGTKTSSWYKTNFLEGNYSKYQAMLMAKNTQQSELVIDDHRIDFTDAFKLLGVTIDKDLNFSQHISQVCLKTSRMIGVLQKAETPHPNVCQITNL